MRVFEYNRQRPCPTDRYALEVYRQFLEIQKIALEQWRKGVVNHLLAARDYVDLGSSRFRVHKTTKDIIPVISLRPVIGIEVQEELEFYAKFFEIYNSLRIQVYSIIMGRKAVVNMGVHDSDNGRPITMRKISHCDEMISSVNLIKLLCHKMLIGSLTKEHLNSETAVVIESTGRLINSTLFARTIHDEADASIVGPIYKNTGDISADVDSDLIGSFHRHYNKLILAAASAE